MENFSQTRSATSLELKWKIRCNKSSEIVDKKNSKIKGNLRRLPGLRIQTLTILTGYFRFFEMVLPVEGLLFIDRPFYL